MQLPSVTELKDIRRLIALRILRWIIVVRSHPLRFRALAGLICSGIAWKLFGNYLFQKIERSVVVSSHRIFLYMQAHPTFGRFLHGVFNAVPDTAFALLAMAGLGYLMPETVRNLEKKTGIRVFLIVFFVGFGLTAIVVNAVNREAQENKSASQDARMTSVETTDSQILKAVLNPSVDSSEPARRERIAEMLRNRYILTHSDISPEILAKTEFPPAVWMNQQLIAMGEKSMTFHDSEHHPTEIIQQTTPQEMARLVFTLWDERATIDAPIISKYIAASSDGNFLVEFAVTNPTGVAADYPEIWLRICDGCSFVGEPQGFDRPIGMEEKSRHKSWPSLNPGVNTEKLTALIKCDENSAFQIGLRYSCKNCGSQKDYQRATIIPLGGVPVGPFKLHSPSTFYIPKQGPR
jgi:hypothetical protein